MAAPARYERNIDEVTVLRDLEEKQLFTRNKSYKTSKVVSPLLHASSSAPSSIPPPSAIPTIPIADPIQTTSLPAIYY